MLTYIENKIFRKNNLYNSFLKNKTKKATDLVIYLDIVFPVIFSYEENNELFLSYVVSHDEYKEELNVITTVIPNYSVLEELVNSKMSVFDVFDKEYGNTCIFYSANKTYSHKQNLTLGSSCDLITTLNEYHNDDYLIEDLLPEDDFYLSRHTLNKVNLNEVKIYISALKDKKIKEEACYITKRKEINFADEIFKNDFLITSELMHMWKTNIHLEEEYNIDMSYQLLSSEHKRKKETTKRKTDFSIWIDLFCKS